MDISYPPGSIVWVKLEGGRWWPGEITDDPDSSEATKGLRKPPLAVVKFFDEDCFHVVKSEQHIYPYDCDKKDEFLNRGKDFKMSGKDNFSLQLKFEADVSKAESLCKSSSKKSTTPTNSSAVISALRGAKYASYMKIPPAERFDYGENSEEKEMSWQPFVPRNEVGAARIRQQPVTPKAKETMYSCDTCNFQTTRMDNFIRHHKSHSDPYRFHAGMETEPRYVYDKLKAKARKRVKDGAKGKKRTKKTDEEKKKVDVTPKKRKGEKEERRAGTKKRKVGKEKTPFSNPFEEEEEEKKKEKEEVSINEDDLDEMDGHKLEESSPPPVVEWEEFIKGSSTSAPKSSNTQQSDECKKTQETDEETDLVGSKDSSSSTYPLDDHDLSVEHNENGESVVEHNETTDNSVIERNEVTENSTLEQNDATENSTIEPNEATDDSIVERNETTDNSTIEQNETDSLIEQNETDSLIEQNETDSLIEQNETDSLIEQNETDSCIDQNDNDLSVEHKEKVEDEKEVEIDCSIVDAKEPNENDLNVQSKEMEMEEEEKEAAPVVLEEDLPMEQVEEMNVQEEVTSEVVVEEEVVEGEGDVEMGSEEMVVTESSLHAGEMMVGEEIEIQEIEIQSDGLTANEIVLGDEVVMHLLPEERADADVLMDPMVPRTNDQHGSADAGSIFSPEYASDHSLMAAVPLSKQVNSTSDGYVDKECRENEESVQVCQDIDADMNS